MGPNETVTCINLWRQISNNNAASLCPVDETNEGNCGIPKHLDMYGEGAISGMGFQMENEMDKTKEDSLTISITSTEAEGEKIRKLKEWEKEIKKGITFDGDIVIWNGVIPDDISQFIRDNCETLKWSVKMGDTQVDFTGLTFKQSVKSRRRRLLAGHRRGC